MRASGEVCAKPANLVSSDLAERRSEVTSPVLGGIGPRNTSIEEVPQARSGGLRGKWAWYLRGGGKELPIRQILVLCVPGGQCRTQQWADIIMFSRKKSFVVIAPQGPVDL